MCSNNMLNNSITRLNSEWKTNAHSPMPKKYKVFFLTITWLTHPIVDLREVSSAVLPVPVLQTCTSFQPCVFCLSFHKKWISWLLTEAPDDYELSATVSKGVLCAIVVCLCSCNANTCGKVDLSIQYVHLPSRLVVVCLLSLREDQFPVFPSSSLHERLLKCILLHLQVTS